MATGREHALSRLRTKLVDQAAEYRDDPTLEHLADLIAIGRSLAARDLEVPWAVVLRCESDRRRARQGMKPLTEQEVVAGTITELEKDGGGEVAG